jgi:hypothetical protein
MRFLIKSLEECQLCSESFSSRIFLSKHNTACCNKEILLDGKCLGKVREQKLCTLCNRSVKWSKPLIVMLWITILIAFMAGLLIAGSYAPLLGIILTNAADENPLVVFIQGVILLSVCSTLFGFSMLIYSFYMAS